MAKKKLPQRKPKTPFKDRKNADNHPVYKGRGMGTGVGIRKKIESPEELWQHFENYKQWCVDNAYEKVVGVNKGVPVIIKEPRALIFRGFEGYLSIARVVYDLSHYERDDNYRPILTEIKQQCSMNLIQGGLAGIYNSNLTARLEGIKENIDTTSGNVPLSAPVFNIYNKTPKLSNSEDEVDN